MVRNERLKGFFFNVQLVLEAPPIAQLEWITKGCVCVRVRVE